jgi:hypothetical protein
VIAGAAVRRSQPENTDGDGRGITGPTGPARSQSSSRSI